MKITHFDPILDEPSVEKENMKIKVIHFVPILDEPVAGHACNHPEHGLVFIESGAIFINERLSNYFYWRKVLEGGYLDSTQHEGYWPK